MQSVPLPKVEWSPESTAAYWINRISRELTRHFDDHLRPFGFAMSQMPVLRSLIEKPAVSQKALTAQARIEQPSMAELLVRMVRDGVVKRRANPQDRRSILFSLTEDSRKRLSKAKMTLLAADRTAMAGLSDAEQRQLCDLLRRIARNIEKTEPERGAGAL